MSAERIDELDERTRSALDELQELIKARYPKATFTIGEGDDPPGVYLKATVDIEDVDDVVDACGERLLEMQVDERLPVYVIPLQPVERVLESMRAAKAPHKYRVVDLPPPSP